eukprot:PhM_4_TR8409/c0_g1_i7/m.59230
MLLTLLTLSVIVLCCAPSGTDASVASILARGERARRMADVAKAKRPHAVESASSHTSAPATAVLKFASPWWTFSLIVGDRTVAPYNQSGSGMTYFDDGRIYQPDFNGFSGNLLFNYTSWPMPLDGQARHSATSFTVGDTWYPAVGGTVEYYKNTTGGTAAKITGIRIGAYATETWTVSVDERNFTWTVDREYTQDSTEVQCNRFNNLVWNTQMYVGTSNVGEQAQIPSTADNSFQWNNSLGFYCRTGRPSSDGDDGIWAYTYTPKTSTQFLLSPADLTLVSHLVGDNDNAAAASYFTMMRADWQQNSVVALGVIANYNDTTIRAGQKVSTAWTLQARPDLVTEAAPLQFTTDNTNFDEIVKKMARLFNMWEGNMFGNSPTGVTCIHEMSFYTQISSVFNPVGGNQSEYVAMQRTMLRNLAENAVWDNGYVFARWMQTRYWNSSLT